MHKKNKEKLSFFDNVMGLSPLKVRIKQAQIAILGEEDVPPSKFGLSSLKQFYPTISPRLWMGKPYVKNTVIISNLFNHIQTPISKGWDVRKTQIRDFRGKKLTYNSHNATDFAIPVGSLVCSAAPGKVVQVHSEFNRGGLKIYIDHGDGIITTYAHLAKSKVKVGDVVRRGQEIALSGYSGIDALFSFPFGIPHVHFNVWLNNEPIDPFPSIEEPISLWRGNEMPKPALNTETEVFYPSVFDDKMIELALKNCITEKSVQRIQQVENDYYKAIHTIIEMNYYPTRFIERVNLYDKKYPRKPLLDLPFKKEDFDNVVFLDEL